ncbi:MAG: universal stress protein [Nitrospira sp.]|nr:universal stress protein [Nitrospira sp.]
MKILAATDGSKFGRWAVEWPARIPFAVKPTIRVLHVVDVAGVRAPFMVQPVIVGTERYIQAEVKRLEEHARGTKQEAETWLKESGLKGTVIVDRGAVAETIMKQAKRGVQLLSIGSRGLDALDRFMLGSVSNHAIHHAPCSVLVVKEAPRPVRRILLAVDGSSASEKAVKFLLRHFNPTPDGPEQEPVSVTVTHVMPFLKYPELRQAGKLLAQRYEEKMAKAGFQVEEAMRLGKPASEILTQAKRWKADLIVTGAKGLGAIGRALLGSVSTRVVQHASCSVLVVR